MTLPIDLNEILHEALKANQKQPDGLLHCSSHITAPLRHVQLEMAGAPQRPNALTNDIRLQTGNLWHEYIPEQLRKLRLPFMNEVRMDKWLPTGWSGTADFFIWDPEHEAFALVDLKTTKGDNIKWVERRGVSESYHWQGSAYLWAAVEMGLPILTDEFYIWYLPMNEVRGEDVLPTLQKVKPIETSRCHATMSKRWNEVEEYVISRLYNESGAARSWTGDLPFITHKLAPVPGREQVVTKNYNKKGYWDLKLKPHYTSLFCKFPEELCNCWTKKEEKIGTITPEYEYIPRKGYEDIEPDKDLLARVRA